MQLTIAVDIAKRVFEIAVSRHPGQVAERHRVSRVRFLRFFAKRQLATVLLEACATALAAFVADIHRFPSARHFASYLGLTPRERSTAQARRLGRISKRGDAYLRMLLIHGARSRLAAAKRHHHPDPLHTWALELERRSGHNRAAVALANRLARIAWRLWRDARDYELRQAV